MKMRIPIADLDVNGSATTTQNPTTGVSNDHIKHLKRLYHATGASGLGRQTMKARGNSYLFPLRVHKHLLGPEEKQKIIDTMRKEPKLPPEAFARMFKRLPATIVKIAAEAGIELAHGR